MSDEGCQMLGNTLFIKDVGCQMLGNVLTFPMQHRNRRNDASELRF